jgi:hypothetical protein
LTLSNGQHAVDRFLSGGKNFIDWFASESIRWIEDNALESLGPKFTVPVNWLTNGINYPAKQLVADGYFHGASERKNSIASLELIVVRKGHQLNEIVGESNDFSKGVGAGLVFNFNKFAHTRG